MQNELLWNVLKFKTKNYPLPLYLIALGETRQQSKFFLWGIVGYSFDNESEFEEKFDFKYAPSSYINDVLVIPDLAGSNLKIGFPFQKMLFVPENLILFNFGELSQTNISEIIHYFKNPHNVSNLKSIFPNLVSNLFSQIIC